MPRRIFIEDWGIAKNSDNNFKTALFALPSFGGALVCIKKVFGEIGSTLSNFEFGFTFTNIFIKEETRRKARFFSEVQTVYLSFDRGAKTLRSCCSIVGTSCEIPITWQSYDFGLSISQVRDRSSIYLAIEGKAWLYFSNS